MGVGFMQKRSVALVFLFVLVGIALAVSYFLVISPSKKEIIQTTQQLDQEKKLLATVNGRLKNQQDDLQSTQGLQRKLPVKPLTDQYILDLEKAELMSGSQLQSIGISNGDAAALFTALGSTASSAGGQTGGNTNQGTQPQPQAQGAQSEAKPQQQAQAQPVQAPKTDTVKKLTFALSVQSPKYEDMLDFIKRLEGLERVSKIDSFSFAGNPESPGINPVENKMNFSVTVSTFYLAQMDELTNALPWIEYPKPAGKTNPLFSGTAK